MTTSVMFESTVDSEHANVAQDQSYEAFLPTTRQERVAEGIEDAETRMYNCSTDPAACH